MATRKSTEAADSAETTVEKPANVDKKRAKVCRRKTPGEKHSPVWSISEHL